MKGVDKAESKKTFNARLDEARTWCSDRARADDAKWSLRSSTIAPDDAVEFGMEADPSVFLGSRVVEEVARKRSAILAAHAHVLPTLAASGGRLLACYFDRSNQNYASSEYSGGFFDGNDNPPWDCWIAVVGTALISWIPPAMLAVAVAGMEVEIFDTLVWVDEDETLPGWLRTLAQVE